MAGGLVTWLIIAVEARSHGGRPLLGGQSQLLKPVVMAGEPLLSNSKYQRYGAKADEDGFPHFWLVDTGRCHNLTFAIQSGRSSATAREEVQQSSLMQCNTFLPLD